MPVRARPAPALGVALAFLAVLAIVPQAVAADGLAEVRLTLQAGPTFAVTTQPRLGTFVEQRAAGQVGCGAQGAATYEAFSDQFVQAENGSGGIYLAAEPRLARNVTAAPDGLELHWVMTAQAVARVVVSAALRDRAADALPPTVGPHVLAQGTAPATLAQQATSGATWSQVGGLDLYEVTVPLAWSAPPVFPQAGYSLLVQVRSDDGLCGGSGLAPPGVAAYADPAHPAYLRTRADAAPRVTGLSVSPGEEGRVLVASIAGAWGSADVDAASATLELHGPGGREWPVALVALQEHWRVFGHAFEPDRLAWTWDAQLAPAGAYNATLRVPNLQHTAWATASLAFENAPVRAAPAAGTPAVALGLLAAGLLARRRA